MKKYNLSEIMKRAWEIKKDDMNNIFSFCLRMAWDEAKEKNDMTIEEYLKSKGLKVWEKGEMKRIYINDLSVVGLEKYTDNPKGFRKVSMYYDVATNHFFSSGVTGSRKNTITELINGIRMDAEAC